MESFQHKKQHFVPGHAVQSDTCLAEDTCLIADPGVAISIPTRPYIFVEIDPKIFSTAILLPSPDSKRAVVNYKRELCMKHWITA